MLPQVTTRHFQCAHCAVITQMLIRLPRWVCPRCGHEMAPQTSFAPPSPQAQVQQQPLEPTQLTEPQQF
jgi:ribosomal protein L37AE/L43A